MTDYKQRLVIEADASSVEKEAKRLKDSIATINKSKKGLEYNKPLATMSSKGAGFYDSSVKYNPRKDTRLSNDEPEIAAYKELSKELVKQQNLLKKIDELREKQAKVEAIKEEYEGERRTLTRLTNEQEKNERGLTDLKDKKVDLKLNIRELRETLSNLTKEGKKNNAEYAEAKRTITTYEKEIIKLDSSERRIKEIIKDKSREIEKQRKTTLKSNEALEKERASLRALERELKKNDIETDNLAKSQNNLERKTKETTKALEKQGHTVDSLRKKQEKASKRKDLMSRGRDMVIGGAGFGFATSGLMSSLTRPITTGIEVEKMLSRVEAKALASIDDEGLRASLKESFKKQAFDLGQRTSFSTSQVLQGQEELALSGFTPDEILKATPGLLTLGKAGDISLGDAANVSTGVLRGFDLDVGENINKVNDILAFTASNSKTNVTEMGEAFKNVSGVARELFGNNITAVERTSSALAVLANSNIRGSEAGNALKATFSRLAAPTGKAADLVDELGIETTDANGDLLRFSELLQNIHNSTKDLASTEKIGVIKELVGEEPAPAFLTLLNKVQEEGVTSLRKLEDQMANSAGMAEKMATIMGNNSAGGVARFNSALESFSITFSTLVMPTVTSAIEMATDLLNYVNDLAKEYPNAAKGVAMLALGLGAVTTVGSGLIMWLGMAKLAAGALGFEFALTGAKAFSLKNLLNFKGVFTSMFGFFGKFKGLFSSIFGIGKFLFSVFSKLNPILRVASLVLAGVTAAYSFFGGDDEEPQGIKPKIETVKSIGNNESLANNVFQENEQKQKAILNKKTIVHEYHITVDATKGSVARPIADEVREVIKELHAQQQLENEGDYGNG